jgi:hypothetical protein
MKRFPLHGFASPFSFALTIATFALPLATLTQQPSKQQTQLRSQIESALTKPWQITGFEQVDPSAPAWRGDLPGITAGYIVTCEDLTTTSTDIRSKDSSNSAGRHPGFALYMITRSASVTPAAVHAKLSGNNAPMVQRAFPVELGSNSQFVVACMDQCSGNPLVQTIVAKLNLKPLQEPH